MKTLSFPLTRPSSLSKCCACYCSCTAFSQFNVRYDEMYVVAVLVQGRIIGQSVETSQPSRASTVDDRFPQPTPLPYWAPSSSRFAIKDAETSPRSLAQARASWTQICRSMPCLSVVSSSCIANVFKQGAKLEGDEYVCSIA